MVVVSTKLVATTTVCGSGQMPRVRPHSPWRRLEPSKGTLSTRVPRPEKKRGDGGGTSSRRDGVNQMTERRHTDLTGSPETTASRFRNDVL